MIFCAFRQLESWWQCWLLTVANPVVPCIDLSASLMGRAHPLTSKMSSDPFKLFNQRLLLFPLYDSLNYLALNLDSSFIHTRYCLGPQSVLAPSTSPAGPTHLINECRFIMSWASFLSLMLTFGSTQGLYSPNAAGRSPDPHTADTEDLRRFVHYSCCYLKGFCVNTGCSMWRYSA